MKKEDVDDIPLPIKQRRLRQKRENKEKNRLKTLLHDSRPASEIAREAEEDDSWLKD